MPSPLRSNLDRSRQRTCAVSATALAVLVAALCAAPTRGLAAVTDHRMERVEMTLNPAKVTAADRARLDDRTQAIADAIASGIPLWRSFDPREVLHDTLATLARAGADVGEEAVLNFDTVEVSVPEGSRDRFARLGFVSSVHTPGLATPTGTIDSEGLEAIGSDIANAAGINGTGIKVAVIDSEWHSLAATMSANELPQIPTSQQFSVALTTNAITGNATVDGAGQREHGAAAAEVVHEVAPSATLLLYKVTSTLAGAISSAAIEAAIRHAADQGAKVILVPLHFLRTMSDPKGVAQGGTNTFTDDIDYATAAGATVVVPAGNEQNRHYADTFTPCTDCNSGITGICNTAANDTSFHAWDGDLPLNDLTIDDDYDFYAENDDVHFNDVRVTCYSATDAAVPANFKMQLIVNSDLDLDYPTCPRDSGASPVAGTKTTLGQSFTANLPLYFDPLNFYSNYYFIDVQRTAGTETPHFRIDCTIGVSELAYYHEESSLSDLAVVTNSLSVAGVESPAFQYSVYESSQGPSGDPNGPIKPDIAGPSEVSSFAVDHEGFVFDDTFKGTSAAASHVAGVVALVQSYRQSKGLPLYTVAEVKQVLFASAIDLDDGAPILKGPDVVFGHGLVQIPAAILPGAPGTNGPFDRDGDVVTDPATYNASTGTWAWLGSTAGQTNLVFGGTSLIPVAGDFDGDGKVDAALYDPSNGSWTFSTTSTAESAVSGVGGAGFVPAPGDYDGDGKTDPGVYNPTTGDWKWKGSTSGDGQQLGFGGPTRVAVPADFDGDGKTDVATFEDTTGKWQYIGTTEGPQEFVFSPGTRFIPAPADFDGDGKADAATFQKKKGKWRMRLTSLGGLTTSATGIGASGWVPVPGDYDGDGKADPAAYRKANGLWKWQGSKDGTVTQKTFGGGSGLTPVVAQRF